MCVFIWREVRNTTATTLYGFIFFETEYTVWVDDLSRETDCIGYLLDLFRFASSYFLLIITIILV